ncbi:MAG: HNH endonuclease signature motif containing protein [Vulcanimicrobiota bacterium]
MNIRYNREMELDPVSLTLEELMQMDALALHHLAKKSAGTLTRYQALLGRLLLAIERTGAHLEHGCSGGVHYAVMQLGLPVKKARLLIRVARELEGLPYLRYLANAGEIEWSKLREIVRVATPESERDWAQLCSDRTYAEIEDLVARSQWGEIPDDQQVRNGPRSELRCRFDPDQMAVLERGLQAMCQQAGRALSMAEAIEMLFAEKLSERPVDDKQLERVRQAALKDLRWTDVIGAETESVGVEIVNPKSRVPSKAQRRAILRRDGYCCAVPGCPNTLWLEVHHIIFYADGGLTKPENLITICSKCHKNVHEGRLKILGDAPRGARFLNEFGRDIRQERTLETAFWLDIWCGWRGTEFDRRYLRLREGRAPAA